MARHYQSRTVRSMLREHDRAIRRNATVSKLNRTGLSVPEPRVTAVDGDLQAEEFEAGVNGWRLRAGGDAEFNDLTLRGGIIGNDALTSPVKPQSVWQRASGFSLSTSWSSVITTSVTVPAGFTTADIDARARVTAFYNNAGTGSGVDYLYAILYLDTVDSEFYPVAVTDNGGSGTNQVFRNTVITGLSGGDTITLNLQASTGYNTWASPYSNNVAQLGASIRWTR